MKRKKFLALATALIICTSSVCLGGCGDEKTSEKTNNQQITNQTTEYNVEYADNCKTKIKLSNEDIDRLVDKIISQAKLIQENGYNDFLEKTYAKESFCIDETGFNYVKENLKNQEIDKNNINKIKIEKLDNVDSSIQGYMTLFFDSYSIYAWGIIANEEILDDEKKSLMEDATPFDVSIDKYAAVIYDKKGSYDKNNRTSTIKQANTNAKATYVAIAGQLADYIVSGKLNTLEDVKKFFPKSTSEHGMDISKKPSAEGDLIIYNYLMDNDVNSGYVYFEVDDEFNAKFAHWTENRDTESMVGQYPNPKTDPNAKHKFGEKF